MEFVTFIAMVVLISLSGVMAPGPLFAATLSEGRKNRFSGLFISAGHAVVEIPLILILFFVGVRMITDTLKITVGIAGGVILLYFAYSELKGEGMSEKTGKGLLSGIILSMANPYFLIWWFTVGFMLTIQSAEFGLAGLVAFIIAHEACDFTWLGFVGYSSGKIAEVWGKKAEKILKISSAAILIFFGFYFLLSGILELQKIWV